MSRSPGRSSAQETGPAFDETLPPDSMEELLAAVAAAPPVALDRAQGLQIDEGTVIDQTYRVLRRLGGGGMGVVYLAEHIELQRQVALKLHLGSVDSQELSRLRREARVMAKLSHPNVLMVHGVGTHEERMFIAMEFAEGGTLTDWMDKGPHPWRETVAMLVQAGRGLAAAHHVGVVHRDFKPDNVLIGSDGQLRVADFGLARRTDEAMPSPSQTARTLADEDGDIQRFTVTGAVVGTPAYMSPEQFGGFEVGPASDQFAYCVVLYQALTGRRPFSGQTLMELMAAVHTGKPEPGLDAGGLPRRLVAAVLRGLRPVPGERHASMQGLVEQLEHILAARGRRLRWGAAGTAVAGALLVGGGLAVMAQPRPCEGAEQEIGAAWDDERRQAVAGAWSDVDAGPGMLRALDDWTAAWGAQRRDVCEATRVREDASELAFGLRMACLDRLASRLDGLTSELASRGADETLDEAIVIDSLTGLEQCEDVDQLERLTNRYAERSDRESVAQEQAWVEAVGLLAQVEVRTRLGREGVVQLTQRVVAIGEEHDLPRLQSKALEILAERRSAEGDAEQARTLHEQALALAVEGGSDHAVADLALSQAEAAFQAGRLDTVTVHLRYFEAFVSRVHEHAVAEQLRRRAQVVEGNLRLERGDHPGAVERLAPVALDDRVDPMLRRPALMRLGRAYKAMKRWDDAVGIWTVLSELITELRGAEHPDLASVLNNMATVRTELGLYDRALADLQRAEAIVTAAWGPEHPLLSILWTNHGRALRYLGQHEPARALQERSLALREKLRGPRHPSLAFPLHELAELSLLAGDHDQAAESLKQALALRREALGSEHPLVAESLHRLAVVHLERGAPRAALPLLQQALKILPAGHDPEELAELELLMARALVDQDAEAAHQHAQIALTHARQIDAAESPVREAVEAWIRARPAPEPTSP